MEEPRSNELLLDGLRAMYEAAPEESRGYVRLLSDIMTGVLNGSDPVTALSRLEKETHE